MQQEELIICGYSLSNGVPVLQVGGVDPKQLAVYEEFARNVPGFLPSNDLSQPTGFLAQPMKVRLFSGTHALIPNTRAEC